MSLTILLLDKKEEFDVSKPVQCIFGNKIDGMVKAYNVHLAASAPENSHIESVFARAQCTPNTVKLFYDDTINTYHHWKHEVFQYRARYEAALKERYKDSPIPVHIDASKSWLERKHRKIDVGLYDDMCDISLYITSTYTGSVASYASCMIASSTASVNILCHYLQASKIPSSISHPAFTSCPSNYITFNNNTRLDDPDALLYVHDDEVILA